MRVYKKLLNIFCLVLCVFGALVSYVPETEAATLTIETYVCSDGTFQSNISSCSSGMVYITDSGDQFPFAFHHVDGLLAYCLEFGIDANEAVDAYNGTNWSGSDLKLSNEQIKKIELIAYYGYGYGSHTSSLWYAATQKLIWETVDSSLEFTVTRGESGESDSLSEYEKEILKLVNNFGTLPSFAGETISGDLSSGVTLTDSNGVLSNWNVTASNSCAVSTSGSTVTVTCSEGVESATLSLTNKHLSSTPSVIYVSGSSQKLGVFSLNTPSVSGSVTLVNTDEPEESEEEIEYPTITKTVSKSQVEIGEEFKYYFEYTIDDLGEGVYYNSFLIEDEFEPVLKMTDASQVKIYNESGDDVTDLYSISVSNNKLGITVKDLTNDDFYGHTYTVEVTTELLSSVDLSSYESDGLYTIPNEVTLTVDGHVSTDNVPVTYEVVLINVPDTAAKLPFIILGGGLGCISIGVGGYYFLLKKRSLNSFD